MAHAAAITAYGELIAMTAMTAEASGEAAMMAVAAASGVVRVALK